MLLLCALLQVLLKGDDRLADVIAQYAADSSADLVITGSQNLCVDGESTALQDGMAGG